MADCMTWTQRKFNPHTLIDCATLTVKTIMNIIIFINKQKGACIVALGTSVCGIMGNDDDLI